MVKQAYKEKLIALISKHFPSAKIYLYGSRARGDHSLYSDIDIAIDVEEKVDAHKMALVRTSIEDLNIPLEVDVVDFYEIPEKMRKKITTEGVLWKQ